MSRDLLSPIWSGTQETLPKSHRDWEDLLGQARQARLLSRLARHLLGPDAEQTVLPLARPYLEGAQRLADRQRHEVQWEVDCLRRALGALDVPVVLLKGAAYLMAGLPPGEGRLFADIDIMVPKERIAEVEGALFAAGWISEERDPYNQRYYREWMHEVPPLRHVQRDTYLDLHHTITPPTSRFKVEGSSLMARAVEIRGRPGFKVLMPTDMVLHSAVHLFQEGEFGHGLRDLLDLRDLIEHFQVQPEFWSELIERAEVLGLQIPLHHAHLHLRRLFGFTAPSEVAHRIEANGPGAASKVLMGWLLGLALRPDHPSCDSRWTRVARWVLYVRSHVLRMPLRLVVPHLLRKAWMRHFPQETNQARV
ncbi:nucleotidyltransferase domain-containing protein [Roseateles toxinivorans]|uniref:Putative nucleotidyltransferase-like protein n=1 Tax=Roseateles toxinivorans TaxID=270368 RepID=A0A4R6QTN4_9BURK|nr:nucleotidyltransferase family protein [Roseateles toxinivorans]TDP74596.1 putative nucleotidyltransferase-like protein [Roseateles toxinivorans]